METKKWKWFRYDEIFDIKHGFYNKKPENNPVGNIPFIGATDSNNGVTSYSDIETIKITTKTGDGNNSPLEEKVFDKCIAVTNNGSVGYAYYQDRLFTCTHDVNPIYLKGWKINKNVALFLCTIIEQDRFRWAYGRKWRPKRMPSSLIKLPVDNNGNPDWLWMEDFVKNTLIPKLPQKAKNVWQNQFDKTPISDKKLELNVNKWQWFKLNELFDYERGTRLTKPDREIGNTPLVTAGCGNEGIAEYICNEEQQKYHNAITIDMFGFSCYRGYEFSCDDNILVLKNKFLNVYNGQFIATIISKDEYKCAYGRQYRQKTLLQHKIKLPALQIANGEYEPDWQWMEDYIKSLPYSKNL